MNHDITQEFIFGGSGKGIVPYFVEIRIPSQKITPLVVPPREGQICKG